VQLGLIKVWDEFLEDYESERFGKWRLGEMPNTTLKEA